MMENLRNWIQEMHTPDEAERAALRAKRAIRQIRRRTERMKHEEIRNPYGGGGSSSGGDGG